MEELKFNLSEFDSMIANLETAAGSLITGQSKALSCGESNACFLKAGERHHIYD